MDPRIFAGLHSSWLIYSTPTLFTGPLHPLLKAPSLWIAPLRCGNGPQDFCRFVFLLPSDAHLLHSYPHYRSSTPPAQGSLPMDRSGRASGLGLRGVRT